MAEAVRELIGRYGLDTTDLQAGVRAANRELRVLESGFRANTAALGNWANNASGLEARVKSLTSQIDVQKLKVAALQEEYNRLASEGKTSAAELQNLQIKINKETETLGKMGSELGLTEQALAEMGAEGAETGEKVDDLGAKTQDAGGKMEGFKKVVGGLGAAMKVGITAIAGLAAAVAGVGAAVAKLVLDSAATAGALVDLSTQTGISTTRLQELTYAGDQLGASQDTITGAMSRLTRSISTAAQQQGEYAAKMDEAKVKGEVYEGGLGNMAAAFERLGVSLLDTNGQFRDNEVVFAEALDALGKIENETERDALAMEIFGKSAQELNPLIKAGSTEIAKLSQEAHDMGAVMAEEDVAALEGFGDSLASLQAGLKGTLGTLATAFLPAFNGLVGQARKYLGEFSKIVSQSNGDLSQIAVGVGQLIGKIITDLAAQAPQMLQAGLAIIKGIGTAILGALPTLIPAVVQMIASLVGFIITALPMLMQAGVQIILSLVNSIVPQLPTLIQAGLQMILALVEGLAAALPQLVPVIADIIPRVVLILIQNLPLIINAALKLILALVQGLIAALPILIAYAPKIITAVFDALVAALPMIGQAAVQLVMALFNGIVANLPLLGQAAVQVVSAFVIGYQAVMNQISQVGAQIVSGVWSGISSQWDWFWSQVLSFFTSIVNGVKNALGIHSPSTVFGEMGENMALGLGKGFNAAFGDIERSINGAVGGLGAGGSAGSKRGVTNHLGGITIIVQGGGGDPARIGQAAERGVRRALRAVGGA